MQNIKTKISNFLSIFFWSIGFHKIEKEHKKKFLTSNIEEKEKKFQGIIVMINGLQLHGGFADRIRGICTIYWFCKIHNIPFAISHTAPFKLEDYLLPNKINWIIEEESISHSKKNAKPVFLMEWMFPHKYHKLYLQLNCFFSRKQLQIYTNSHFYYDHFSESFHDLFKPAPKLSKAIEYHKKQIGDKYIAIVFRFQQLLGDFKEGNFKVLSKREQDFLIEKCIKKVSEFKYCNKKILITSDSRKFLNTIEKRLNYVYTIPGNIVHIDYTENANYDTYLKSFLDFYMISEADEVYLALTDDMYKSGFPKTASKVNNRHFEILSF